MTRWVCSHFTSPARDKLLTLVVRHEGRAVEGAETRDRPPEVGGMGETGNGLPNAV